MTAEGDVLATGQVGPDANLDKALFLPGNGGLDIFLVRFRPPD